MRMRNLLLYLQKSIQAAEVAVHWAGAAITCNPGSGRPAGGTAGRDARRHAPGRALLGPASWVQPPGGLRGVFPHHCLPRHGSGARLLSQSHVQVQTKTAAEKTATTPIADRQSGGRRLEQTWLFSRELYKMWM